MDPTLLAALYVKDAFAGRLRFGLATTAVRSSRVHKLFKASISPAYIATLAIALFVTALLAFFEPPKTLRWPQPSYSPWVTTLHAISLAIIGADIAVYAFIYNGIKNYLRKKWHAVYFVLTCLSLVDFLLKVSGCGCPLRCLRGLLLLTRFHILRRICSAVVKEWRLLLYAFSVLLFIMFLTAAIGVHLLSDIHEEVLSSNTSDPDLSEEDLDMHKHDFVNLPFAFVAIFRLLTTENYPKVMSISVARNPAATAYFIGGWYFLSFIFLGLMTALIVENYWARTKAKILTESRKERLGLLRAFSLLDKDGCGFINRQIWNELLSHLMPHASNTEKRVRFAMLDSRQTGEIDWKSFLQIGLQLELRLQKVVPQRRLDSFTKVGFLFNCFLCAPRRQTMSVINHLDTFLTFGQLILLLVTHPQNYDAAFIKCTISLVMMGISVIAFILRVRLSDLRKFHSFAADWSMLSDALIFLICVGLFIAMYIGNANGGTWGLHKSSEYSPFDLAFICELLLGVRLLWKLKALQGFAPLLLNMTPIIASLTVIFGVVLIFFATVGMEIFSDVTVDIPGLKPDSNLYQGESYFGNFHLSLLTMTQVLISNDWHSLDEALGNGIDENGLRSDARTVGSAIFFCTAFFTIHMILYPVLLVLATNSLTTFSAAAKHSQYRADGRGQSQTSKSGRPSGPDLKRGMYASFKELVRIRTMSKSMNQIHREDTSSSTSSKRSKCSCSTSSPKIRRIPSPPSTRNNRSPSKHISESESPPEGESVSEPLPDEDTKSELRPKQPYQSSQNGILEDTIHQEATSSTLSAPSCFFVHMRKTKHYSVGGWRRDLIRSELGDMTEEEMRTMQQRGILDTREIVRLWQAKRPPHSKWLKVSVRRLFSLVNANKNVINNDPSVCDNQKQNEFSVPSHANVDKRRNSLIRSCTASDRQKFLKEFKNVRSRSLVDLQQVLEEGVSDGNYLIVPGLTQ